MRFIFALTIVWFCSCAFFNCWFYVVAQGGHSEGVGRRGGWLFGWLVAGRSCRFHWVGNFFGIWIVVVACRRLFVGCIWPCSLFYFHSLLLPPPPPHGFPFFIWQISAHAGPSLVSLKKDTIGAVAAACCLLSVFFFRSLVKWFPHIIAFVVRPTLAQWHAPSPCTPISPSSSRAPNPGHVEIIRQDLCEWATVFAICLQRRRRHQTRTTRTARTARRWQ